MAVQVRDFPSDLLSFSRPVRFASLVHLLAMPAPTTLHHLSPFQRKHQANNLPFRWLRMALSLDHKLRLGLRSLFLANPNNGRPGPLRRRLGPQRQRLQRRRPRRLARRQRRGALRPRRPRQRLGPLERRLHRLLDPGPLDFLVGRQRLPAQHLERLDERTLGHRGAVDDLERLLGRDDREQRRDHHGYHGQFHGRADDD